jgi:transcriptional regulator with XRE-family HTH domain
MSHNDNWPANIRDVAAAAGVSTATVSRAVRGLPNVAEPTRQKILAASANLGYVASSAASELARRTRRPRPSLSGQFNGGHPETPYTANSRRADPREGLDHPPSPGRERSNVPTQTVLENGLHRPRPTLPKDPRSNTGF